MPTFMDYHNDLTLSQEMLDQLAADTKAGTKDQFGVSQLDLYYNDKGHAYCLLSGPDEAAIRAHHDALGLEVGAIDRVDHLT